MSNTTYLRSWLTFNDSPIEDFIKENQWEAHGTPVISSDNAANGNALQLDGNSYLSTELELGDRPFTIRMTVTVDPSTQDGARLLDIKNPDNGNLILSIKKDTVNSVPQLQLWKNATARAYQDNGTWITLPSSIAADSVGTKVTLTIYHNNPNFGSRSVYFYCNDKHSLATMTDYYERHKYQLTLGMRSTSTVGGIVGSIDEFQVFDGAAYYGAPSDLTPAFYNPLNISYKMDTLRKIDNGNVWRYENVGEIDSLINTTTAVKLENLPETKSVTGTAFYQTTTGIGVFDIPSTDEIWIKTDIYFNGTTRWRIYDYSTGASVGITAQTKFTNGSSNYETRISVFTSGGSAVKNFDYRARVNEKQTIILRMKSGSSGVIEVYAKNAENEMPVLIGTYTGSVSPNNSFGTLCFQSDGAETFFSNTVISNAPLWLDDNASFDHVINQSVDIERTIEKEFTFNFDTERQIICGTSVSFSVDMERTVYHAFSVSFSVDLMRMTHVPGSEWRYDNIGLVSGLIHASNATQLSNLPSSQSKTGVAFYNSDYDVKLFDVPNCTEYWIRFDVCTTSEGSASVGDDNTIYSGMEDPQPTGLTVWNTHSYGYEVQVWACGESEVLELAYYTGLKSFLVHMRADATNGFVEAFMGGYGLLWDFSGDEINTGDPFEYLSAYGESTAFISNVIISNQPLWLDDDAITDIRVSYVADMERVVSSTVAVSFDAERVLTDGYAVAISFDTMRMTHVPASEWRYENIGKIDTLQNTTTAVQLSNLPSTQSRTGVAFYQTEYDVDLFNGTQQAKEVWMRFDVYRTANGVWRFFGLTREYDGEYYSDIETGVSIKHAWKPISDIRLDIWNGSYAHVELEPGTAKENEIQSVLIHAVGGSAAQGGMIEVFTDNGGLIYEYYGEVHDSNIFKSYTMYGDSDAYVSNIIISNQPVWLDEVATMSEAVRLSFDVSRQVDRTVTFAVDTERELLTDSQSIAVVFDTSRIIVLGLDIAFDLSRSLDNDLSFLCDTERMILGGGFEIIVDMERRTAANITELYDKERVVGISFTSSFDTERTVIRIEIFLVDMIRWIPYQLVITTEPEEEPTVIPIAQNDAGLQSINIQISEQQITDRVSFVHAGNNNIMDKIQGTYRDYVFDLRVEETTTQGVIQEVSCCSDIDELLYSQIAYTIPENKYEWDEDYLRRLGITQQENPDDDIEAQPSTTIEEHLRTIAQLMGKSLVYRGTKFYSTANVKEQGGKTYASVISELIGWSSRLPHLAINAYFRGGVLYVIQRGHEANTVNLNGAKIANVRVNKKLVRTTWGSDVWSKSTVDTYINDWQEFDDEPYTPEAEGSSRATYNDDNLVESTTTESESEKTETHYYYEEGANGEKYLAREVTTKWEKDDHGQWQEYDTVVTTHERVSATQSHIYSGSAVDGSIYGEVVSPNRFDDRATPYEMGRGSGGRAFIIVHDGQGNYYKLYGIKYYSEELEKGTRTTYGLSLIDTSFPVYGESALTYLTQQLMWLNRKTEETVTLDVYDVNHVIGFDDRISLNGAIYFLRSNDVLQNETIINKQSLTLVRWY